jgi:hypothetical protein
MGNWLVPLSEHVPEDVAPAVDANETPKLKPGWMRRAARLRRNPDHAKGFGVQVRLDAMELHRPRQWGACWLACHLYEQLELDRFFAPLLPELRQVRRREGRYLLRTNLTGKELWRFYIQLPTAKI